MGGDFNSLPRLDKRIRGDQVLASEIDDFANCISRWALQEMRYKGLACTWSNKQGPTRVFLKLDRCSLMETLFKSFLMLNMSFYLRVYKTIPLYLLHYNNKHSRRNISLKSSMCGLST